MTCDRLTRERQIWSFSPRVFTGELTFVPHPQGMAKDDAWLLLFLFLDRVLAQIPLIYALYHFET